jgi:hypothetical protein
MVSPMGQAQRKVPSPESQTGIVILEIIEVDARPKVAGDEYLHFRIYESGKVEFEDQHQNRLSQWEFEMHKLKLNEDDKEDFINLARKCLSLPNDYDPLQRKEEKISITKIRIRDDDSYRQVLIHNYSPENEKTQLYYPKIAKELMQKVRNIRKNYHQIA